MGQLQEFLGLENYISEKNFDMEDKLPCFKENVETKCLKGTKGRSVGKEFESELGSVLKWTFMDQLMIHIGLRTPTKAKRLQQLYEPFDLFFSKMLDRSKFDRKFGIK